MWKRNPQARARDEVGLVLMGFSVDEQSAQSEQVTLYHVVSYNKWSRGDVHSGKARLSQQQLA